MKACLTVRPLLISSKFIHKQFLRFSTTMKNKKLLVLLPDYLSALIEKGEITRRYYNPTNTFHEVHIVMTNDDNPNPDPLLPTVGDAQLSLYNIPTPRKLFHKSLGYRPLLLRKWASKGIEIAKAIKPDIIRCHGNHINTFVAAEIKRNLNIPVVVSMHINPDIDVRGRAQGVKQLLYFSLMQSMERYSLQYADIVLPVYKPIIPYLKRMNVQRFEVVYNSVCPNANNVKEDYTLNDPVRILSVGRIIAEKFPINVAKAISDLNATLDIYGNGPELDNLQKLVAEAGLSHKVNFIPAVENAVLCEALPKYDIFATHSDYFEISKSVLEPLNLGLPVIINKRPGTQVPEFAEGNFVHLVENTVEGYKHALEFLINNPNEREALGVEAKKHAELYFNPDKNEKRVASIYHELIDQYSSS